MLPLLLFACSPSESDPWEGVPLQRGVRPAWASERLALEEALETRGNGRRLARRVVHPTQQGSGKTSFGTEDGLWASTFTPAGGALRTWELTLHREPERLPGVPIQLSPNGASVVGREAPGEFEGVVDFGKQAFAFGCRGEGADLDPQGWCLAYFGSTFAETWEEPAK